MKRRGVASYKASQGGFMLIHVARGFVVESSGFSLRLETIHVTACAGPCHDTVSPSVSIFLAFLLPDGD